MRKQQPFFFSRFALPILMAVFFAAPFAMRGARLAVQHMRNDVKDWLPSSFEETAQLDWFREHFLGEQFIAASWENCTGTKEDARFRMMVDKFFRDLPPSRRASLAGMTEVQEGQLAAPQRDGAAEAFDERLGMYVRQLRAEESQFRSLPLADSLGLYSVGDRFRNWGEKNEKWLRGAGDQWYYILPNGDLYRWEGSKTLVGRLAETMRRWVSGKRDVHGELVETFGPVDGPWYYHDPRRLEASLFKTVTTGPALLYDLTREGGALEDDVQEAKRRLGGVLFGPDGKQTCLLITLTEAAKRDMRRVVGRGLLGSPRGKLLRIAEESGIAVPARPSLLPPPLDWLLAKPQRAAGPVIRMGGPAVDNVAIDEEGHVTLVRLVGLCVAVGLGLSWLSFRSLYVMVMVFIVGGLSAVTGLSIVWWSGSSVDAVMMSMPSLVYVLGLSGAVHIVNYYREAARATGLEGAPERSLEQGWKPCTLAALTTGVGLLSLSTSNIVPIQKFGFYSAVGVVATLALLFTYLPSALQLWPPGYHLRRSGGEHGASLPIHRIATRFWRNVGVFVIRRHGWVLAFGLLILAVFSFGLGRINTSIQLLKLFDRDAKIIRDYQWLETHLGNLVPMELIVRIDPAMMRSDAPLGGAARGGNERLQLSFLERMEIATYLQRAVETEFGSHDDGVVGQSISAATFAPPLPGPVSGWQDAIQRSTFSRLLESHRDQFLASDYLRTELGTGAELWRISLRLEALGDVDYGQFVNELKRVVEPIMTAYEFRERILTEIDRQAHGEGFRGAQVYLVDSQQQSRAVAPGTPAARAKITDGTPRGALQEKQHVIFVDTLRLLLRNAGIRTYDVQRIPQGSLAKLSDREWVVLLGDVPQAPRTTPPISTRLVDARQLRFDLAEGIPTAADQQAHIATVYTGVVPVVYKAQRTLLQSLIRSTGWAFVMIAIVMMVLVRSPRAGLISMIPNVFPVILIFGAMGWLDIAVDIGSMMTASVAMGVAVDDTIHYLTWFRRGLDEGRDRKGAILLAYERCATAMTQTTLIGGLGLSIFALSTFTPTQRFGILMLVLMVTALVGDLVLLPAILASPLGRLFTRRRPVKGSAPSANANQPHGDGMELRIESAHGNVPPNDSITHMVRQDGALGSIRSRGISEKL